MSSIAGIPGITPAMVAFVATVREYMRDYPEVNRLIQREEASDRQILWAVVDALTWFNGTGHITKYSLEDLLDLQQHALLRRMVTVTLLESAMLLQTRNHLNYSSGGTNVGVNDKAPMITSELNYFRATTDQQLSRAKVVLNIRDALVGPTGLHSEYWFLNQTYQSFLARI
jgi:hypothetical protein